MLSFKNHLNEEHFWEFVNKKTDIFMKLV